MESITDRYPEKRLPDLSGSHAFDLGQAFFKSGNFEDCVFYLRQAGGYFVRNGDFSSYMDCYNMLIRAFNEMEEEDLLLEVRREFEENLKKHNIPKSPRVLLANGFYFGILKQDDSKTTAYFKEALQRALKIQQESIKKQDPVKELESKIDIMYCLEGFFVYYYYTGDYDRCRQKINDVKQLLEHFFKLKEELQIKKSHTENVQLQKHFQSLLDVINKDYLHINRVDMNVQNMEALLETDHKKARQILWKNYEKANALNEQNLVPYIFLYMVSNSVRLKETEQAHLFLNLAKKSAKAHSFRRLLRHIEHLEAELFQKSDCQDAGDYDIVFDQKDHSFIGKHKGCVQFKNQFILLDLLNLFIENQGRSYSKEYLVKRIWKEDYRPETHDNKLYVTVKRLRSQIEPDDGKSRYILKNREGYYLTNKVKILVK